LQSQVPITLALKTPARDKAKTKLFFLKISHIHSV
jgi:hypothetical protein